MGTIQTGTGLVSGIDSGSLIDQLMQIESRPKQLIQRRVEVLKAQKTAYLDVNSKLLGLKGSISTLLNENTFETRKATSTNSSVLTATASSGAAVGSYTLSVSRLVSTQQMISRGFADADTTPLGLDTSLVFESAEGRLDRETELTDLNGGAGVERGKIRVTDRSGAAAEVDLSRAVTVDDVVNAINNAGGVQVAARIDGDRLVLDDLSGGAGTLSVSNVGTTETATSIGLAGSSASATLEGARINRLSDLTALNLLNDGRGVDIAGGGQADFSITDDAGSFDVSLDGAASIGDVIEAINNAAGNGSVTAAIGDDGASLKLTGTGNISVTALNDSEAAADLGLAAGGTGGTLDGDRVLAAMNSKLLKNITGGAALNAGTVDFTTAAAGTQSIDLSGVRSISDVIGRINDDASLGVTAQLNAAGNGLLITADDGSELTVADGSGNLAATLGLAGAHTDGKANGGDVDFQYIIGRTRLDELNNGEGVASGKFTITDSLGDSAEVDLTQGEKTLNEVIAEINSRGIGVLARLNDTGDGLLIEDTAGGSLDLTIAEAGSTTARDLGILGTDSDGLGYLDGSFEKRVAIEADDTLEEVQNKINQADVGVSANLINDGSTSAPHRLSLTSEFSGRDGRFLFDDGGLDLQARTLVQGRNAVAFYGSSDPAQGVLLTSSTNSLTNTIDGVTINLNGTSTQPVTVSVSRDSEKLTKTVSDFVANTNKVLDRIAQLDSFDQEEEQRGLLLGDPTLAAVKRRLIDGITRNHSDVTGAYTRLTQVGITVGAEAKIEFDQAKFQEALTNDPQAVAELFSLKTQVNADEDPDVEGEGIVVTEQGAGAFFEELINRLTDSVNGTVVSTADNVENQIELANDRIATIDEILAAKRERLQLQFANMEKVIAQLQNQQSALASLGGGGGGLAANFGT